MKFAILWGTALLGMAAIAGCSSTRNETVSYTLHRSPVEDLQKMKFVAIASDKNTGKAVLKQLSSRIDRCGQYTKATTSDRHFQLAAGEHDVVAKAFGEEVAKHRDDRYAHGILYVQLQTRVKNAPLAQASVVRPQYDQPYDWHDAFQATADLSGRAYSFEEISRKPRYTAATSAFKTEEVELVARYSLYNAKLKRLVFDRTSTLQASVANYSSQPGISRDRLHKMLYRQVIGKIVRSTCTSQGEVDRSLVAVGDETKVEKLIQAGVDQAMDDQWDKAAQSWQNAILIEPKNAVAHHNLGVFYERNGNIPKAIDEFDRARTGKLSDQVPRQQFQTSLFQFRPGSDILEVQPKILSMSSSNWVTVVGGKEGGLKPGKIYPVYRSSAVSNENHSVRGIRLVEVGKIRVEKAEGGEVPRYEARTMEFTNEFKLATGDTVILH